MEILSIGQKIRNRRKELNMTLKELAGRRVTAGQLSFVELGKSNPSGELLQYIAERLGVTVDYLLESEESQAKNICEYNIKLSEAYVFDDKDEDAEPLLNKVWNIAGCYNLGWYLGKVEFMRGRIDIKRGKCQKALQHFLGASKFFLENNDYSEAIKTFLLIGRCTCENGFHNLALSYFKESEILCEENKIYDEQLVADIKFSICMCCIRLGYADEADKYLPSIERYLESMNDKKQYAHGLMDISLTYNDAKDYEKALYYANRALKVFKELEDKEYLSKMQMNIGNIYYEKGDIEKSNYYLNNCRSLNNILNTSDMAKIYLKLANNNIKRSKYDEAMSHIEQSFRLSVESKNIDCQIECYECLYRLYMVSKNYKECENVLKNKLNLLKTLENSIDLAECYIEISEYYKSLGQKQLAVEYMNKSLEELDSCKIVRPAL